MVVLVPDYMESKKLPPQNEFVGDDDMRFYGVLVSVREKIIKFLRRRWFRLCGDAKGEESLFKVHD